MHSELHSLAAGQGGVVTGIQARKYHRWEQLQRWIDDGLLQMENPPVYRLAPPEPAIPPDLQLGLRSSETRVAPTSATLEPDEERRRLLDGVRRASVLLGRPAVACSYTAAALHGFGVLDDGQLHINTAAGWSRAVPDGVTLHQAPPRGPNVRFADVLVTNASDTAVDLASVVEEVHVLAVLDAARRHAGVSGADLAGAILLAAGRRGLVGVRKWAEHSSPAAESPMESRTRFRLINAGLPVPEPQIQVEVAAGGSRYIDMGWRRYRLGVDYEGEEFHTGTGAMSRDRLRHNGLTDLAWRMFYPTAPDIYRDHREFTSMIRRALRAAGWTDPTLRP